MKTCTKCKIEKELGSFSGCKTGKDGLRAVCKACRVIEATEHRLKNPEGNRRRQAKYRETHRPEIRQKNAEYMRQRYEENPEPLKARALAYVRAHPEEVKARRKQYRATERGMLQHRDSSARERIKKRGGNPPPLSLDLFQAIFVIYDRICVYCGGPPETIDHVVSISKNGSHTPDNIVPACKHCNDSKHAHDLEQWLDRTGRDKPTVLARLTKGRALIQAFQLLNK